MIQKFQESERIFIPTTKIKNSTRTLEKFITENFELPDNNLKQINSFIKQDMDLENLIYDLPQLIQKDVIFQKMQIKFFDEFQDDELILEITVFSRLKIDEILKHEDAFIHRLYEKYPEKSADKVVIFIEG